jgi:hypothetical protein
MPISNNTGIDRGDAGATPDPDWSSRFINKDHAQIDEYIASHAAYGPLRSDQVTAILQHLPPPQAGWDTFPGVLDEYAGAISRWKTDVARGATPPNPTPSELAAWCDNVGAELPRAFVTRLRTEKSKHKRVKQAPKRIDYPSWVPLAQPQAPKADPTKKRGRPKLDPDLTGQLVSDAKQIQDAAAKAGNEKTISEIAKVLVKHVDYSHWAKTTIERKLNGQTSWAKNRSIAGRERTK